MRIDLDWQHESRRIAAAFDVSQWTCITAAWRGGQPYRDFEFVGKDWYLIFHLKAGYFLADVRIPNQELWRASVEVYWNGYLDWLIYDNPLPWEAECSKILVPAMFKLGYDTAKLEQRLGLVVTGEQHDLWFQEMPECFRPYSWVE